MSKRIFQVYAEKEAVVPTMRNSLVENLSEVLKDRLIEFVKQILDCGDRLSTDLKEADPARYAELLKECPELGDERPPDEAITELAQESCYDCEFFGWNYSVNDEGFCVTGSLTLEDKLNDAPIVLSSWVELGKNQGFKVSDRIIN